MDKITDEKLLSILTEMIELLHKVYKEQLKAVILYGSVARGTQRDDSDIDILILIDAPAQELREYDEKLTDVSTDLALKYLKVFSIIDVAYQEYMNWKEVSPFYKNIEQEGVVLYAA